jgi:hypothetical protein
MSHSTFRQSARDARMARVGILPNLASPPQIPARKPDFWRRWPRLRSSRRATDDQIAAAIASTRDFVRGARESGDITPEMIRDIRALMIEAGHLSQSLHTEAPRVSDAGAALPLIAPIAIATDRPTIRTDDVTPPRDSPLLPVQRGAGEFLRLALATAGGFALGLLTALLVLA